jgi:hypothetical protein
MRIRLRERYSMPGPAGTYLRVRRKRRGWLLGFWRIRLLVLAWYLGRIRYEYPLVPRWWLEGRVGERGCHDSLPIPRGMYP